MAKDIFGGPFALVEINVFLFFACYSRGMLEVTVREATFRYVHNKKKKEKKCLV